MLCQRVLLICRPSEDLQHRGVLRFQGPAKTQIPETQPWKLKEVRVNTAPHCREQTSHTDNSPNTLSGGVAQQLWDFLLTLKETVGTIRALAHDESTLN